MTAALRTRAPGGPDMTVYCCGHNDENPNSWCMCQDGCPCWCSECWCSKKRRSERTAPAPTAHDPSHDPTRDPSGGTTEPLTTPGEGPHGR